MNYVNEIWRNPLGFIVMGSFHPLEAKWVEKHVVSIKMECAIRMKANSISPLPENCWSTKKKQKIHFNGSEIHRFKKSLKTQTYFTWTHRTEYATCHNACYGTIRQENDIACEGNPKCRRKLARCLHFSYLIYWTYLCNFLSGRTKINKRYVDKVSTKTNGYSLFL